MPFARIDDTLEMHYEDDCFAEPWREPEAILLVHGIGGTTEEWFEWVPPLAGRYRVIRVDLRGWGRSSVPPEGYRWSMAAFAADLVGLLDHLGIGRVHYVGAKLGGRIGLHLAANHPERLHSLTLVCTPMTIADQPGDSRSRRPSVEGGAASVAEWARRTMRERIGDVAPERMAWWIALYSAAHPRVISEVYDLAWDTTEFAMLERIAVPTLVIDSAALRGLDTIRAWQERIAGSRLVAVPLAPGEGRQINVTRPQDCVAALLGFLEERGAATGARTPAV